MLKKKDEMTRLNEKIMTPDIKESADAEVDAGLVAMFLKMTPEERVRANDNAVNAITEMRNAFRQKQLPDRKYGGSA